MLSEADHIRVPCPYCNEPQEIVVNGPVPHDAVVLCSNCREILGDWRIVKIASDALNKTSDRGEPAEA